MKILERLSWLGGNKKKTVEESMRPIDSGHREFIAYDDLGNLTLSAQEWSMPVTVHISDPGKKGESSLSVEGVGDSGVGVAVVPFHGLVGAYNESNANTVLKELNSVLDAHRVLPAAPGKDLEATFGPMSCLVVKEWNPSLGWGRDILRLNMSERGQGGRRGVEVVVTERVIAAQKGTGVALSQLARWGGRKEVVVAPERTAAMIPWGNVIAVEGFWPRPDQLANGMTGSSTHELVDQPALHIIRETDSNGYDLYAQVKGGDRARLFLRGEGVSAVVGEKMSVNPIVFNEWESSGRKPQAWMYFDAGAQKSVLLSVAIVEKDGMHVLVVCDTTDMGKFNGQYMEFQNVVWDANNPEPKQVAVSTIGSKARNYDQERLTRLTALADDLKIETNGVSVASMRSAKNTGNNDYIRNI